MKVIWFISITYGSGEEDLLHFHYMARLVYPRAETPDPGTIKFIIQVGTCRRLNEYNYQAFSLSCCQCNKCREECFLRSNTFSQYDFHAMRRILK